MFGGGGSLGSESLGGLTLDTGAPDAMALRPILTEINGVDARASIQMDSLHIQDTLGQPVTASFTSINEVCTVGDRIRIFYFSQLIFSGTIDHVQQVSPDLTTTLYQVDCLDWSQTLFRRKLQRNFTNLPIQNILDSILDNELAGEGLTIGTIDTRATMPLVDSKNARVFDVLRDMAGATGQTFYVDFDQTIQMRSVSIPVAPLTFSEGNVLLDGTSSQTDRETYRNVQTVIVTGTPQVQNQDALVTKQQRTNADQIAARAAIEGGTGIYEEVEEITHPTSNDGVDIALLGIGYARLRLATSGTPRQTVKCSVRGYGFRAGQIATVNLPTFGLIGTFIVQRVTIREEAGQFLFHDLELTTSSLQQRAYEAWLGIVKGGKVTVQMPGSLTTNLQTFNTPGTTTWTVPAGVTTAEFTCSGGSGGGGGGFHSWTKVLGSCVKTYRFNGGTGGNSGKAITIQSVIQGQIWDIVVGSAGTPGINGIDAGVTGCEASIVGIAGVTGSHSFVSLGGVISCQGNAGTGGAKATTSGAGADGGNGSGIGDAVSVGGGKAGGSRGIDSGAQPSTGSDGLVEVRW